MRILLINVLVCFVCLLQGQNTVSGTVVNSNNESLIQASVFIVDSYFADVTDDKGRFELTNIPNGTYTLKVSYVGYNSVERVINVVSDLKLNIGMGENILQMDPVDIWTNRVSDGAAFAYSNLEAEDIEKENMGQDVPFLLRWTPSAVVTSDAGTGIGYTGIRVRGSDPTRINVTINGVPLNDSESQGVFWVDLPDFMSSVDNVQIQRGVGTSTNGAGAFGGSIGLSTNKLYQNPYVHANVSGGSFNTRRLSVNLGTGLLNDKFSIDGRYSIIKSDGYIDRGSADLSSWYFSAARLGENSSLRFTTFSGKEVTYQAWNGVPESRVDGTSEDLQAYYDRNSWMFSTADSINLFSSDRRYNFYTYENQVDDYQQDHYQLHYTVNTAHNFTLKSTLFYTRGAGFFEEFKPGEDYEGYDLPLTNMSGDSISSGDLVRRRWLDNDYYGLILGGEYTPSDNVLIQLGSTLSNYKGDHFGHVITAEGLDNFNSLNRYYEGLGEKSEINAFAKTTASFGGLEAFVDLQIRSINYTISGEDDDLTPLDVEQDFSFFNPKLGLTYRLDPSQNIYTSFAIANREPQRGDFIDNLSDLPESERLYDIELGYRKKSARWNFEWNNYYMIYRNQLVLRGDVNNSGAYINTNVGESYRLGAEIVLNTKLTDRLMWGINTTISRNKLDEFIEVLDEERVYENTDISFSPSLIAANTLLYTFNNGFQAELSTKYVGKQYLDNTQSDSKSLPAYTFSNLRLAYDWNPTFLGSVTFQGTIYNLFDSKFSSNGYTFSYVAGPENVVTENFLFPQAGIHFMLGANVNF